MAPVLPAEKGNGLAMRAGLFLEALSRSHSVSLAILPVFGDASLAGDLSLVERLADRWTVLPLAGERDARYWAGKLLSSQEGRNRVAALHPLPAICRRLAPAGVAELSELASRAELIVVVRAYLLPAVESVLDDPARPPLILDLDELDSEVHRQLGRTHEAARFEQLERHYLPLVDHITVAGSFDAALLKDRHRTEAVSTVINAVRPPRAAAEPAPAHDLLFVGNLRYAPNVEGVRWLCEEVCPRLPGVTIALVGSNPVPEVAELAEHARITLAADVPCVSPWYAGARVAVAPLHAGGGTCTKVVEALVHDRPVVATSVGARGLPSGEEAGVLIADDAAEFANACQRLLDDPMLAARVAAAGRRRLPTAEQVMERVDALSRAVRESRQESRVRRNG